MKTTTAVTNQGKAKIYTPENWDEVSVEQYQDIIGKWDKKDWLELFSILSGLKADAVAESKDGRLEGIFYETIAFVYDPFDWEKIPVPKSIELRPIWQRDCPLIPVTVDLPKKFENLSIGQAMQARQSLSDMADLREGISIITAICLQPLIDKGKFDMARVIEIEQVILKMSITKVFPIGFFLLRRLNRNGRKPLLIWSRILRFLHTSGTRN